MMYEEGDNTGQIPGDIEALRCILESEQSRTVEYAEALDVGYSLITFFEALAEPGAVDEQGD